MDTQRNKACLNYRASLQCCETASTTAIHGRISSEPVLFPTMKDTVTKLAEILKTIATILILLVSACYGEILEPESTMPPMLAPLQGDREFDEVRWAPATLVAPGLDALTVTATYGGTLDPERVSTAVDSYLETLCEYGRIITGLSGGWGHSSAFNVPHDVECSLIRSSSGVNVDPSGYSFLRQTLVDDKTMIGCPDGYVMTGFTGGYGHSDRYNTPHYFRCSRLLGGYSTKNHRQYVTLIDNDTMTSCPDGYAMTGVSGGFGHSNDYNEGHVVRCSEVYR